MFHNEIVLGTQNKLTILDSTIYKNERASLLTSSERISYNLCIPPLILEYIMTFFVIFMDYPH